MQDHGVGGIDGSLHELDEVAIKAGVVDRKLIGGGVEELVMRERRLLLLRPEIHPEQAARLAMRIHTGLDPLAEVCGLAVRRLEDCAVGGKLPPVIETS